MILASLKQRTLKRLEDGKKEDIGMVNEAYLIVRKSGRHENTYYIDYSGKYKAEEIARVTGLDAATVEDLYTSCGGYYDETQDVYYFHSHEEAGRAISDLLKNAAAIEKGRFIFFSETEVEYIKKSLISETQTSNSRVKDAIFEKLNKR